MAKVQITIAANATAKIGTIDRSHINNRWEGVVYAYGTFGGGTVAFFWSPDNGTTLLPINDLSHVAVTCTANYSFPSYALTGEANNNKVTYWATLSGATSPSITVGWFDNN